MCLENTTKKQENWPQKFSCFFRKPFYIKIFNFEGRLLTTKIIIHIGGIDSMKYAFILLKYSYKYKYNIFYILLYYIILLYLERVQGKKMIEEESTRAFKNLIDLVDFLKIPSADALLILFNPRKLPDFITGEVMKDYTVTGSLRKSLFQPIQNVKKTLIKLGSIVSK